MNALVYEVLVQGTLFFKTVFYRKIIAFFQISFWIIHLLKILHPHPFNGSVLKSHLNYSEQTIGSNPLSSKYFNFALIFEMVRNNVCKKYLNTISHRSVFYFFSFLILIVPGWFLPTKKLEKLEGKKYHAYFFSIFFCKQFINIFVYTRTSFLYLHKKKSYTHLLFSIL